ncbi:M48 family metallopeptidase [Sinirhodobacter huangdaonensis]|uniref:M48 family metallopeptidase n=1 Tax=Paenirhodobacter huangdaonensis TaxID=2501515 RepID=A0A443LJC0_9RHOB|nr:M48 family metallopeptidase [Sinirhodobacter huangdaonensis]RWR49228.1 M48 family metallopeptidase [Sinirhodobacter huangdaonensis]
MLLRLLPILLMLAYGLVLWHFSARSLARALDAKSRRLNDSRLAPVLDRLAAALGVATVPVHVYEIEAVNGLAAPDGRVFLTEGFLRLYRDGRVSAEEIGAVIAHELGHVARGHARRRMIDFTGQNALRAVLAGVLGRMIPFAGVWIANTLTTALAAKLSRRDEFEADEFATALLIKAGYGAGPQIALFEKLEALTGATAMPAWLATHPAAPERIAAIRRHLARWQG